MSIKITNAETKPALVFDRFFLESLSLTQRNENDNGAPPVYSLRVQYRVYALDEDNQRHFNNKCSFIEIPDYYALAMEKAATGDMDLAQAMAAIEQALAKVIGDQTELGEAEVV